MVKLTPKPTQVQIDGIQVRSMFDSRFLDMLEKTFPGVRYSHFTVGVPLGPKGETDDMVTVGHYSKEHGVEKILTVDCSEPETLRKLIAVLESFTEEATHG